jgi:hypothetical protein
VEPTASCSLAATSISTSQVLPRARVYGPACSCCCCWRCSASVCCLPASTPASAPVTTAPGALGAEGWGLPASPLSSCTSRPTPQPSPVSRPSPAARPAAPAPAVAGGGGDGVLLLLGGPTALTNRSARRL